MDLEFSSNPCAPHSTSVFKLGHFWVQLLKPSTVIRVTNHCGVLFRSFYNWCTFSITLGWLKASQNDFSYVCLEFPGNSLCLLPLPVTEKGLAPLSLLPPIRFFTSRWYILTCSLLHTKQSISYPLIIFVTLCWTHSSMSMFLLYWGAQNSTQHRCGAPRKGVTSLNWPAKLCILQPRRP